MSLTAGRTPQRKVFGEADKRHIPHPTPFVVTGAWELSSAPNPLCGDRCEGRADFTYPLQGRMASRAGSTSPESSEMDGDSRPENIRAGSVPPEGGKPDGPQIPRKTLLGNSAGGGLPRIPRRLGSVRGGVRQDSVSRLPVYPPLESGHGSAVQDITGISRVRRHPGDLPVLWYCVLVKRARVS